MRRNKHTVQNAAKRARMKTITNIRPSRAYKFAHHQNVPDVPPDTETTRLLEKAFSDDVLTREEKDKVASTLYGLFGPSSATYKLSGWAWYMYQAKQMHRILVSSKHEPNVFQIYFAPDKTSLRKALASIGVGVKEMIQLKK